MKRSIRLLTTLPTALLVVISTQTISSRTTPCSFLFAQEVGLDRSAPDQSVGWDVFDKGFATRSPVAAGEEINIRVLSVGNGRGVAVTYSGNLAASTPGQLWAKPLVLAGATLRYQIPEALNGQKLAVRSGTQTAGFDEPVSAEPERGAYLLKYKSGRTLMVSIGRRLPRPHRHVPDISGGWTADNMGFASNSEINVRSTITVRVINSGNDTALAVTYSGNLSLHEHGKLWLKSAVQDGVTLLYQVPQFLSNRRLENRSGASTSGLDKPRTVAQRKSGYRLIYFGDRIVDVIISNPGRNIGSPGPQTFPHLVAHPPCAASQDSTPAWHPAENHVAQNQAMDSMSPALVVSQDYLRQRKDWIFYPAMNRIEIQQNQCS